MASFQSPWSNQNDDNSSTSFVNPWSNMTPPGGGNYNFTPDTFAPSPAGDPAGGVGTPFWKWNGVLDNPFTHAGKGLAELVGGAFDKVEHLPGLNQATGLMKGMEHGYATYKPDMTPAVNGNWRDIFSKALQNSGIGAVGNAFKEGFQGILNPDQARENVKQDITDPMMHSNMPAPLKVANSVIEGMNSPLGIMPFGAVGKGLSRLSDAAGATPYITKGLDALKATKPVQAFTDTFGKAFVKDYGATPDLSTILRQGAGEHAANQHNTLQAIRDMAQSHGLSPNELTDIGHIIEQTKTGTPAQAALAQKIKDLIENGAPNSGVGSNLLSNTASAVSGDPLLEQKIANYFPHSYDNVPDELKGVFPRQTQGVGGLSANGTYNLPRTFATLDDAQKVGLKPVLDPFQAAGQSLNNMSKAYTNNHIIEQIKSTPGLLFDKDPIDEVSKLVKTGRMTTDQAAQQLGMTVDDLKKGFVQSQIPQLRGAYIRPADEAALKEFLQPSQPTGILGAFNKATNLYNKGFLINPLPHMHNIYTNGVGLGEANPKYIKEAYDAIKSGTSNPWYEGAIKSGAVTNAGARNFKTAVDAATQAESKNPLVRAKNALHDILWNNDAAIRTALFRGAKEAGKTDAESAAHTNKFMVDYQNLTPFEKTVMKPLVPFYSWKKGNIPLQVSQTFAQTPKYVALENAKEATSQLASGQPTDNNGRIQTNINLQDGSHVAIDPYLPMEDAAKVVNRGPAQWAFNTLNPFLREVINQGTSAMGAFLPKTGIQNKYGLYNAGAPAEYNARKGVAHAINALNPFGGSAMLGEVGDSSKMVNQGVNRVADLFGGSPQNDLQTKDKPGQTAAEMITKLLGGFSGRDNPQKDAVNQQYQQKDDASGQIKYLKETGQSVPKMFKRQAFKKVAH